MLTLYPPGAVADSYSAYVVQLSMEGNLPFIRTQVQPVGRRQVGAKCELDSGSTGSVLFNSPFVTKRRLVSSLPRSIASKSGGVGGTGRSIVGRIASISLGKATINSPIAVLFRGTRGDNASDEYDCLIGGAIFRRFKVTFDMPGGRLYLEPTAALGDPFETDMSGMELLADGSDLSTILIDEVHAGSAAAKAGVRGGDLLQAIDDKPASELGLREIRRLFQDHGASHELTLRRGKSMLKVQIHLRRVI